MARSSALALVSPREIAPEPPSLEARTAQCVELMLQALIANNGDSILLRSGEIPFMVCEGKTADLSPKPLPGGTVERIAAFLLPAGHRATLEEVGGTRYRLPRLPAFPAEAFTILAGEPGPDFWLKILRDSAGADWLPPDLFTPLPPSKE